MAPRHRRRCRPRPAAGGDWVLSDTLVDAGGSRSAPRAKTSRSCTRSRRASTRTPISSRSAGSGSSPTSRPAGSGRSRSWRPASSSRSRSRHPLRALARPADPRLKGDLDRAELLRLGVAAAAARRSPAAQTRLCRFPQPHPLWRFVFVNHALTNPFFVPARYGSEDAASAARGRTEWTGSTSSTSARW